MAKKSQEVKNPLNGQYLSVPNELNIVLGCKSLTESHKEFLTYLLRMTCRFREFIVKHPIRLADWANEINMNKATFYGVVRDFIKWEILIEVSPNKHLFNGYVRSWNNEKLVSEYKSRLEKIDEAKELYEKSSTSVSSHINILSILADCKRKADDNGFLGEVETDYLKMVIDNSDELSENIIHGLNSKVGEPNSEVVEQQTNIHELKSEVCPSSEYPPEQEICEPQTPIQTLKQTHFQSLSQRKREHDDKNSFPYSIIRRAEKKYGKSAVSEIENLLELLDVVGEFLSEKQLAESREVSHFERYMNELSTLAGVRKQYLARKGCA